MNLEQDRKKGHSNYNAEMKRNTMKRNTVQLRIKYVYNFGNRCSRLKEAIFIKIYCDNLEIIKIKLESWRNNNYKTFNYF